MIRLKDIPTTAPEDLEKEKTQKATEKMSKRIGDLLNILAAQKKHSMLVILQGMDASGKDGIVKNVFEWANPTSIDAYSFKKPTEEEFAHDFLWRCHKLAPRQGQTMIFIRSHYEDILIQRVHAWIDEKRVEQRMAAINAFEELLEFDNKTKVLKFYLHISPEKQMEKLQERIDLPEKQWKHNDADWEERKLWDKYMDCYEYAINNSKIPWNIIPCDQQWYRNFCTAKVVLEALESMNLVLPTLSIKPTHG